MKIILYYIVLVYYIMFELFWSTLYYIFPCMNKDKINTYLLNDDFIFDDEKDFDISKLKIQIPK